jgi:hypothetical protein
MRPQARNTHPTPRFDIAVPFRVLRVLRTGGKVIEESRQ